MRTTRRTTRRALRKLIERRSTGGDAVTSPKRTAALALTTVAQRHLARGPDGFVRGVAWRGVAWRGVAWRGVMVSTHGPRSVSFFIPYRVPIRVPYGQHDGQRANLSAGGSSQQYRPATLGPGHRATIVWLHLGPGHRAAVLLSAWRYPWALPRRYGKHQKLYREDSPYSIIQYGSAPARLCPRSQRQAAQFHLHYSRWLSPSRCHQKC